MTGLRQPRRAAVLLIVLLAMMFAVAALVYFIEKSTPDLLMAKRDASERWMRRDAENALEAAIGVLAVYRDVLGDFHHPDEGWGDPLSFAGFEPEKGRRVTVTLTDESGRIPLVDTDYSTLVALLRSWGLEQRDAEQCADSLLLWSRSDYVPRVLLGSEGEEYRRAEVPYKAPGKALRSFAELRSIAVVREKFFDEQGVPNEIFRRFTSAFSLLEYDSVNINAASPDILADPSGLGSSDASERLGRFRNRRETLSSGTPTYFRSTEEAKASLGPLPAGVKWGAAAQVLRVQVTVSEGGSRYHLSALIAPEGKARWPATQEASNSTSGASSTSSSSTAAATSTGSVTSGGAAGNNKYPFEVLEISEQAPNPALAQETTPDSSS